jgi:hypothetical protein
VPEAQAFVDQKNQVEDEGGYPDDYDGKVIRDEEVLYKLELHRALRLYIEGLDTAVPQSAERDDELRNAVRATAIARVHDEQADILARVGPSETRRTGFRSSEWGDLVCRYAKL